MQPFKAKGLCSKPNRLPNVATVLRDGLMTKETQSKSDASAAHMFGGQGQP